MSKVSPKDSSLRRKLRPTLLAFTSTTWGSMMNSGGVSSSVVKVRLVTAELFTPSVRKK